MKIVSVFVALLLSSTAMAEQFFCEGKIKGTNFIKQIKLTINEDDSHLLALVPNMPENKKELYSNNPVGIGEIEVTERADPASLVIASGKLIVTQKSENIVTGIHNYQARTGLIRLDKNGKIWNFVYYDSSNHKELVFGSCK